MESSTQTIQSRSSRFWGLLWGSWARNLVLSLLAEPLRSLWTILLAVFLLLSAGALLQAAVQRIAMLAGVPPSLPLGILVALSIERVIHGWRILHNWLFGRAWIRVLALDTLAAHSWFSRHYMTPLVLVCALLQFFEHPPALDHFLLPLAMLPAVFGLRSRVGRCSGFLATLPLLLLLVPAVLHDLPSAWTALSLVLPLYFLLGRQNQSVTITADQRAQALKPGTGSRKSSTQWSWLLIVLPGLGLTFSGELWPVLLAGLLLQQRLTAGKLRETGASAIYCRVLPVSWYSFLVPRLLGVVLRILPVLLLPLVTLLWTGREQHFLYAIYCLFLLIDLPARLLLEIALPKQPRGRDLLRSTFLLTLFVCLVWLPPILPLVALALAVLLHQFARYSFERRAW